MEIKELFSEEQVEILSDNVINKIINDINKKIQDSYYEEIQHNLNEHYQNFKDNLEHKLINQIIGEFLSESERSKYKILRKKLFEENKEFLTKILTHDYIENEMKNIFFYCTDTSSQNYQKWLDGSIRCINQNWDKFKDNEYIKNSLFYNYQYLKEENEALREKIKAWEGEIEDEF